MSGNLLQELAVKLGADITDFEAKFGDALKTAKSFQKEFKEVGKKLTEYVTLPLVGIAAAALEMADSWEIAEARMASSLRNAGVDFDSVKGSVVGMLGRLEALTGFTKTELANAFSRLTDITGNAKLAMMAMSVAADLARQRGMGLDEAATLVGKALDGNVTQLKRYGITIQDSSDKLGVLTQLHEKFGGASEKYLETSAGAWTNVKTKMNDAFVALGTQLMPVFVTFADVMVKVAGVLGTVAAWFGSLSPVGKLVTLTFVGIVAAIGPLLVLTAKAIALFKELGFVWTALNAIDLGLLVGLAALAFFAIMIIANWSKVGDFLKSIFLGIAAAVVTLIAKVSDFQAYITSWIPGLGAQNKVVADQMDGMAESVQNSFSDAANSMGANGDFIDNTVKLIGDGMTKLAGAVGLAGKVVKTTAKGMGKDFSDLNGNAQSATFFFNSWATNTKQKFSEVGTMALQFFTDTGNAFADWGRNLETDSKKMTDELLGQFGGLFAGIASGLAQGTLDWKKTLADFLVKSLESIVSWAITNMEIFKALSAAISAALTNPIFAIIAIAALIAGVAALSGSFSNRMAGGGIANGPTNAVIGENGPEAVIPLDSPRGRSALNQIGGGNRGSAKQTIIVQLDGRTLSQAVVENMPAVLRLQGVGK